MKGCFYLQRRFAYLGHALVLQLQQRHGMAAACGMVSLRPSLAFLQTQKDVAYGRLLLEEDLYAQASREVLDTAYLQALEERIGIPNIWVYIMADRVVRSGQLLRSYPYDRSSYSHEEMLRIVQSCTKGIEAFLEEERPDFILFSVVGNISSLLLYRLAHARGIRTLFIDCARIGTGYFLADAHDRSPLLWETWKRLRASHDPEDLRVLEESREWLRVHRAHPTYYLASSGAQTAFKKIMAPSAWRFLAPAHLWRAISWTVQHVVAYYRDPHITDYTRINPWWNVWDKMMKYARLIRGYGYLFVPPVEGESFAYFALHSEPEAYPTILAPFYTDQVWLAKQIARSLPVGWKLYVKDHPAMRGLRRRSYYKELRRIPNVRLIDPQVPGLEIAAKAQLTLTLTGTAAWEAALLGRPAVIFGNMFYQPLSAIKRCTSIETLPQLIRDHVATFRDDPEEIASFIAALRVESVDVDLVHLWDVKGGADAAANATHLAPLADRIADVLRRPSPTV